ncbi:unnamed protein product [Vicia faba]|uniref:Uncharacterized protein n=1 Tax=Vicia faba TaxID=3906 RepID=A0AAV0Z311_VICFA|nr:unnamed protein product [Vicia faba]
MIENPNKLRLGRHNQTASARQEGAEQTTRCRGHSQVPREEVDGTSSSTLRSRLSSASLSKDYEEEEPERVQVSEPKMVNVPESEDEANPELNYRTRQRGFIVGHRKL